MVKKSAARVANAKRESEHLHVIAERDTKIKFLEEELIEAKEVLSRAMKQLVNPPFIQQVAEFQMKLKTLESQVGSYGKEINRLRSNENILKAQLLLGNRALSQFMKPTT